MVFALDFIYIKSGNGVWYEINVNAKKARNIGF